MPEAVLGVTESVTGKVWLPRVHDDRVAQTLQQRFELPDLIARCLSARGIGADEAEDYLNPTLRALMPDPSRFRDMDKAAARFAQAVMQGEAAAVFGDYDVDGGTSSALLLRFTRALGVTLRLYIPDRSTEGYGPNVAAMRKLAAEGFKLAVCVDCGTTAHEPLAAARDAGLDVIVIDHHTAEPALPPCVALVNPNRLDEDNPYGNLAAVGVTFLFVVAVNRALRQAGWFTAERTEPDLMQWLDLVALGTVCDVVPLTGLNRAYVAQGLRVMARGENAGLRAMRQSARMNRPPDTFSAGFVFGPRVNAGGRVGQSDLGARLLATDDVAEANALALRLDQFNTERKRLEQEVLGAAEHSLQHDADAPLVFAAGEGWHPGVIGIVAARLKERYHRPTIVVALDGDTGKASGRSVRGLDLGSVVIAARQEGLLLNGGGHAMAAGFTVSRETLEKLKQFLTDRVKKLIEASPLVPSLTIDGLLAGPGASAGFAQRLGVLEPFGTGNPEPRFAVPDCKIVKADVVGENHVRCIIMAGPARLGGIAFRALDNPLGKALLESRGRMMHLAGTLKLDEWQGVERVQLQIADAAFA
ncbi:MAG: single-stranded-DNA-specific exonuclease RecJ [Alphaproteobacteria bacterium]|nr:single-stranded-DNA-specific exonuclease RecJ [Alphaproteobacteria bacterium]